MKYFTGVGSRQTPNNILEKMVKITTSLQDEYCLRSGAAPGADTAFEFGCTNGNKEIYLPWKGFNGNYSKLYTITDEATEIASEFHPAWNRLNQAAKKLMARNVYQVLGYNLNSPSEFLLAWTQDGCESQKTRTIKTGGTGLAIAIASYNNIPVINMFNNNWGEKLLQLLN